MNAPCEQPVSGINRGRLRWHCRRGLLELDLVFTRFLDRHFDRLDEEQLKVLERLLAHEDQDLWDIISGRGACEQAGLQGLVELLRAT
ncbi:MAG: succinate dehydrogenase assembly factor 2 [Betaproteobacteria bacterium]|nr:succinate dehydrogenase assembly factor 2 [Betaproteobacteria bacterium]